MKKTRVAIIFGGRSGEHEVSIASAMSLHQALDKSRYDVTMLGVDKAGRWLLPDQSKLLAKSRNPRLVKLNEEPATVSLVPFESRQQLVPMDSQAAPPVDATPAFDVVIPILHGTYGEDGTIQGLLELANIPYVGAGVLGSALGMDKDASRRLLAAGGIPVVQYRAIRRHEFVRHPDRIVAEVNAAFRVPYFVKPANAGSSVGVCKVKNHADALAAMHGAFAYDTKVLIEQGVNARELEVAVLGNEEPRASIVGEVVPAHEFYSYEAKYIDENGAELRIPAGEISADLVAHIQQLAVKAFRLLECRGLARVDFFLDRDTGHLYLNEINTLPGFTRISMYPKLWEASGLPYPQLLDELIRLALERHAEKNSLKTSYDPAES